MNFSGNHLGTLFKPCHFDRAIIIVCIRWCSASKLSYRDLVAIMTERNVDVVHPTILRWVQRSVPECEKRWQRYARPVGTSWRVDATYLKVKGQWDYLSRAVDSAGQTVDFLLSAQRDRAAAKHFFKQTIEKRRAPEKITLDGYAASHGAVAELQDEGVLPPRLLVRTNRYVHNLIEQEHCQVKERVRPMLGFKCFAQAAITLSGIGESTGSKQASVTFQHSALLDHALRSFGSLCWPLELRAEEAFSHPQSPLCTTTPKSTAAR